MATHSCTFLIWQLTHRHIATYRMETSMFVHAGGGGPTEGHTSGGNVGFSRHAAPADAHGSATGFLFRPDLVPLLKVACRESVQYVIACESIA